MNQNRKKNTVTESEAEAKLKGFLDMIAPSVIQFHTDHYICGNTYRSVWALREYPTATDEQAILRHLGEKDGVTLRIYTRQVTPAEEKKIISNAANKNRMKQGSTENLQETVTAASNLQDVTTIIAAMHRNREPLLHTAVFIELSAQDMDKLKLLQTEVLTELIRSKLNVDKLLLRQKQGFMCVHPAGRNVFREQFERALPASSVANLFPFNYSGKTDKNGFYIGRDKFGSNVIVDFNQRADDKTNANILILGNSGQGKSYLLKLILTILRESGMKVICLDPEHEYIDLTNNLGGCFVDLMSGEYIINVLEPKAWDENGSPEDTEAPEAFRCSSRLSQHISFLKDFFRTYKNFTDSQIDTIEIMLGKLYEKWNIRDDTDFGKLSPSDYPVLSDLYDLMEEEYKHYDAKKKQLYTAELLQEICLGLHSMCKGAESKFFNGHTNIADSTFLTFGVKGLLQASRNVKDALLFNILSYMSNELLTNGHTAASIDEFYLFLTNLTAVEYIRNFMKRVRKKDSAVILASQNLEDFNIDGIREYTKPLFSIPTHAFLFNAGNIDAGFYMDTLQLEKSEYNLIRYPQRGVCLYSTNPSEGYLSPKGIDTMRSTYAHDIFRQEFMSIYEKKTQQREQLKEQANSSLLFLMQEMQSGICHNEKIEEQMLLLSKRLMNTRGKKVYGYLKADVKAIVNGIVDELAKEVMVAECYKQWMESKDKILHYYKDSDAEILPLSQQKELKSLKNMVIREAVRYGEGYLYTEDEGLETAGQEQETKKEATVFLEQEIPQDESGSLIPELEENFRENVVRQTDRHSAERQRCKTDTDSVEKNPKEFYARWTDTYKEAREYLYGTTETEPDAETACALMQEEAEQGNAFAMADLGKMYAQGIFVKADRTKAQEWYEQALNAMLAVEGRKENTYLEYRIGKMYQYGLGTEENLKEAAAWFTLASGKEHKYALYAVHIMDILKQEHEEVERSGNEWRWKRHKSVTFRGNRWYRHSQQMGSHAIDFMQEFFGMTYPEAVTYLLNGESGQIIRGGKPVTEVQGVSSIGKKHSRKNQNSKAEICRKESGEVAEGAGKETAQKQKNETEPSEKKSLTPPRKNDTMKRVYAYLMQKRYISREVLSFFARQGTLYESAGHHNAVFAGLDKEGNVRHIHKKGTCSDGRSFRMNEDGSDSAYGFGYAGKGNRLYVFEAPIDFLSFLTLYPKNWQESSYIVLNGVSEHAMLQMLKDYPNLDTVVLCLDHDPAGIEACGRLAEILVKNRCQKIQMLQPEYKDWNEDLKHLHGEEAVPAQEHPKILECHAWVEILKQVAESVDSKYATKENICRYYGDIYKSLKQGNTKEHLEDAFDGSGMLLTGVLVRCMEKSGRELGMETGAAEILENLCKRYRPHRDKGNYNTRLRNMQKAFEEVMEVFDTRDLSVKENKELLVRKCMSLTMECIRAHIFVAIDYDSQQLHAGVLKKEHAVREDLPQERGMMVCSQ